MLTNLRFVYAGYNFSCAIDDTGYVCWGNVPVGIPAMSNPWVAGGGADINSNTFNCARDDAGLQCWAGITENDLPVNWLDSIWVYARTTHRCAVDSAGVECEIYDLANAFLDFGQTTVPGSVSFSFDRGGDGVHHWHDGFPFDPFETTDTYGDGIGNNSDWDDDNDGRLIR